MSLNIIDLIKGQLGPALVSQTASQLGESESGISKAISGLLPAVVGGLAHNSDNASVLDAITQAHSGGLLSNLLGGSENNSLISGVLSSIFGDKIGGIVNSVAGFAGISNSSSNSLLNMVTGATLGSVGKYAADNNLSASGISGLLSDQKGILSSLLPAGLSLGSLGFGNLFGGASEPEKVTVSTPESPKVEVSSGGAPHNINPDNPNDDGGGSIWRWLLPLILLLLAGWFFWNQCQKKKADSSSLTTTSDTITVVQDSAATAGDSAVTTVSKVDEDIDLNGTALKGYKGGLEDRMITFLKTDGYKNAADDAALKDTWYDFDHVNFKMGSSSELEAGSEGQLNNLVAILKAFPDAKIKIGGYTDKTGSEETNLKVSKARAEFIKNWLSGKGVGAQVLGADGYGSEFAEVPATASDAERASDRKMSIRFTK